MQKILLEISTELMTQIEVSLIRQAHDQYRNHHRVTIHLSYALVHAIQREDLALQTCEP